MICREHFTRVTFSLVPAFLFLLLFAAIAPAFANPAPSDLLTTAPNGQQFVPAPGKAVYIPAPKHGQEPAGTELKDLRTRFSTTTSNGDGTVRTELRGRSVYYVTPSGLEPINRTIVRGESALYPWANLTNNLQSRFPTKLTVGTPLEATLERNITYRWSPVSATAVDPEGNERTLLAYGSGLAPEVRGYQITYRDALVSADESFLVGHDLLKHTITLNRPVSGEGEFRYTGLIELTSDVYQVALYANGQRVEGPVETNGAIDIREAGKGNLYASIVPAYAQDGNYRQAVPANDGTRPGTQSAVYRIVPGERPGTWLLSVCLPMSWLTAPERRYPIEIDPTLILQPGPPLDDAWMFGTSPYDYYNYGLSLYMRVMAEETGSSERPAIKWDLSGIPGGATITNAVMQLYTNEGAGSSFTANVRRATHAWTEGSSTNEQGSQTNDGIDWHRYNGVDSWGTVGGDADWTTSWGSGTITISAYTSITMTSLIQGWVAGTWANYGLFLHGTGATDGFYKNVCSSDWTGDFAQTPKLTIDYTTGVTVGDNYRYLVRDELVMNPPYGSLYSWEGSSGLTEVTTGASLDDGVVATLTLPFMFPLYGYSDNVCYISSNGYIVFGEDPGSAIYLPIPNSNYYTIDPWGRDMYVTGGTTHIYAGYVTTGGSPRYRIVFQNLDTYSPRGNYVTYEIILYPNGNIKLQYSGVNSYTPSYSGIDDGGGYFGLSLGTTFSAGKAFYIQRPNNSIGDAYYDGFESSDYFNTPPTYAWESNSGLSAISYGAWTCIGWGWEGPNDKDDCYTTSTIPLGFTFPFYGSNYSGLYVNSNGYIQFSSPGTSWYMYPADYLPHPDYPSSIMPFCRDLYLTNYGTVTQIYYGMRGTAPNRYFVVSWENVHYYSPRDTVVTFQLLLYENGDFKFQYNDPSFGTQGSTTPVMTAQTVGTESPDGTSAFSYGINIYNNQAIYFSAKNPNKVNVSDGYKYTARDKNYLKPAYDGYGDLYNWEALSSPTYIWQNTSNDDASAGPYPLGFTFPLYSGNFTQFWASPNGFIRFDASPGSTISTNIPNDPGYIISAWGRDMYVTSGVTTVSYQMLTQPTRMVIQYSNLTTLGAPAATVSFQIVIFPNGNVRIHYSQPNSTYPPAYNAGIDDGGGSYGLSYGPAGVFKPVDQQSIYIQRPHVPPNALYQWVRSNYYTASPEPFNWINLASLNEVTSWPSNDDSYVGPFDLGFSFPWFGTNQTQFYIGTNGYITFGTGQAGYYQSPGDQMPWPSYGNMIAPYQRDLYYRPGVSRVYYGMDYTNHRMVVTWQNMGYFNPANAYVTFQMYLYDNGDIVFSYLDIPPEMPNAVGLSGPGATDGINWGRNIYNRETIRFKSGLVPVTVTNSFGAGNVRVDGSEYPAPRVFYWTVGSSHTISVSSPQFTYSGTQRTVYTFSSWSDGGGQTHTITTPGSATTYTANWSSALQYQVVCQAVTTAPSHLDMNANNYATVWAQGIYAWDELAGNGGTELSSWYSADNGFASTAITTSHPFPYWGNVRNTLVPGTNGLISLRSSDANTYCPNVQPFPISGYQDLIAPFYGDLTYQAGTTHVYYGERINPNRTIIEYQNIRPNTGGSNFSFQVVIFETGEIWFVYQSVPASWTPVDIGLQGLSTTEFDNYPPTPTAGTAWTFSNSYRVFDGVADTLWVTNGYHYYFSNPSTGSTASERWFTNNSTNYTCTGGITTTNTYWHQLNVAFPQASVINATYCNTYAPSMSLNPLYQFGANVGGSSGNSYWVDRGSSYTYPDPYTSGSTRYDLVSGQNGTIVSNTITSPTCYQQFWCNITLYGTNSPNYLVNGSYTALGSGQAIAGAYTSWTGWVDCGSNLSFDANTHPSSPVRSTGDTRTWGGASLTSPLTSTINYSDQLSLTITTPRGNPVPSAGTTFYSLGASVTASVDSIVLAGDTRYICTGWSASGSGLSSGTDNNVTFSITSTTFITWNWRTQYRFTVNNPSGNDSPNPPVGSYWYDEGASVSGSVTSPDNITHSYCTGYTGTGSLGSGSGTAFAFTIASPSTVTWNWSGLVSFTVSTPQGNAIPNGTTFYSPGASITASVDSIVNVGDGDRWICTGWTSPQLGSGADNNLTFTIAGNTTLTWNFLHQFRFDVYNPTGFDSPNPAVGSYWYSSGAAINASVDSLPGGAYCTGYVGTGNLASGGTAAHVSFSISQPTSITWQWNNNVSLTVSSAYGNPNPSAGAHTYPVNTPLTLSVEETVYVSSEIRQVCTGWSGTGNVPTTGTGHSVNITLTVSSQIVWNWKTIYRFLVVSTYDSPNPSVGEHWYDANTWVSGTVTSPDAGAHRYCTGYTGSGALGSGSGTSFGFNLSQPSGITWNWANQLSLNTISAYGTPSPTTGVTYWSPGQIINATVDSIIVVGGDTYLCTGWVGTGSVRTRGYTHSTTFTISANSSITWIWTNLSNIYYLDVVSAHDSPNPPAGHIPIEGGSTVTAAVDSVVVEGGITYVCVGWIGTGPVPPRGYDNNLNFTMSGNGSITWMWEQLGNLMPLTVSSLYGTPAPPRGTSYHPYAGVVTAQVESLATVGSWTYVCSGWTGTGSVPPVGFDNNFNFTIYTGSTVTWNWIRSDSVRTLTVNSPHWVPVPPVGTNIFRLGQVVNCSVDSIITEHDTTYICLGWIGTGSVPARGYDNNVTVTMGDNSTITWLWCPLANMRQLTVSSLYGSPVPPRGTTNQVGGTVISASVESTVVIGGITYVCLGWVGTGSVPARGYDNNLNFTINDYSSITWLWAISGTQLTLTVTSRFGSPSPPVGTSYFAPGEEIHAYTDPAVVVGAWTYICTGWTGTGSVPPLGYSADTTFEIDQNSTLTWIYTRIDSMVELNVVSEFGNPAPPVGTTIMGMGQVVNATVESTIVVGGYVYVCVGWTGTGSVPSVGYVPHVTFAIELNSNLNWVWVREDSIRTLTVTSPRGNPVPPRGLHLFRLGQGITATTDLTVDEGGWTYYCAGWTGDGSVPARGYTNSATFTLNQSSTINWLYVRSDSMVTLMVVSAHGSCNPPAGFTYHRRFETLIDAMADSVVTEAGSRWFCIGWAGTGSVTPVGYRHYTSFTIRENSTLTWTWVPEASFVSLDVNSDHDTPAPPVGHNIFVAGTTVSAFVDSTVVEGTERWICAGWNGTGSVPAHGYDNNLTFDITLNSSITWIWVNEANAVRLTVASAYGNPDPPVGTTVWSIGQAVHALVEPLLTFGSDRRAMCIGWQGSGSTPGAGDTNRVNFNITANSALTWRWARQYYLHMNWDAPVPVTITQTGEGWYSSGDSAQITTDPHFTYGGLDYGFTGWTSTPGTAQFENPDFTDCWVIVDSVYVLTAHYGQAIPCLVRKSPLQSYGHIQIDGRVYSNVAWVGTFWAVGSRHFVTVTTPDVAPSLDSRYNFVRWDTRHPGTDPVNHQIGPITGSDTVTAIYGQQSRCMVVKDPLADTLGVIRINSTVYPHASSVEFWAFRDSTYRFSVSARDELDSMAYLFSNWVGGPTDTTWNGVVITTPTTYTAHYTTGWRVTVRKSPLHTSGWLSVDGLTYPGVGSMTFWWQDGTLHRLEVSSSDPFGADSVYLWSSWSDGGGRVHVTSGITQQGTFTANYTSAVYQLDFYANRYNWLMRDTLDPTETRTMVDSEFVQIFNNGNVNIDLGLQIIDTSSCRFGVGYEPSVEQYALRGLFDQNSNAPPAGNFVRSRDVVSHLSMSWASSARFGSDGYGVPWNNPAEPGLTYWRYLWLQLYAPTYTWDNPTPLQVAKLRVFIRVHLE